MADFSTEAYDRLDKKIIENKRKGRIIDSSVLVAKMRFYLEREKSSYRNRGIHEIEPRDKAETIKFFLGNLRCDFKLTDVIENEAIPDKEEVNKIFTEFIEWFYNYSAICQMRDIGLLGTEEIVNVEYDQIEKIDKDAPENFEEEILILKDKREIGVFKTEIFEFRPANGKQLREAFKGTRFEKKD